MNFHFKYAKCLLVLPLSIFIVAGCIKKEKAVTPKPEGYFRIELVKPNYVIWDSVLPFTFAYSDIAQFSFIQKSPKNYWMDLYYPQYNASLKMTFFRITKSEIRDLVVSEEKTVMFHVDRRKADDVEYSYIRDEEARLFGQIYDISGKGVACPLQFWLTDSANYYVRASLYFNFAPNNDSLAPVIQYLRDDVMQMINTWKWSTR